MRTFPLTYGLNPSHFLVFTRLLHYLRFKQK